LLTNVKPPDALSRASAIVNGLPDPLPLANQVTPQVGPAVAAALSKGMSQKRDDRFASANEMREALRIASENPLGEAATVLIGGTAVQGDVGAILSEGATKLGGDQTTPFGSEARTLVAADSTAVRKSISGTETPTLVHAAPRVNNSRLWIGAAALLILIVGGAGGFYAYRARQQTPQNTVPSTPAQSSETNQPASSQPASDSKVSSVEVDPANANESKSEKKVDSTQRTTSAKQPVQKAESKATKEQTSTLPTTGHDADRNPDRNDKSNSGPPPQDPPPFDPRNPQGRRPPHPPGTGQIPEVRTLPNGTRIVTQPDGTRIITGPKGRVQVIPPGDKGDKGDKGNKRNRRSNRP
jgi:hypothetical protein